MTPEELRAYNRAYYARNKAKRKKQQAEYYQRHRKAIDAKRAQSPKTKAWAKKATRKWKAANRAKWNAYQRRRYWLKKGAINHAKRLPIVKLFAKWGKS